MRHAKDTYKRDLKKLQKRCTKLKKEISKRDLQKRPTKETGDLRKDL